MSCESDDQDHLDEEETMDDFPINGVDANPLYVELIEYIITVILTE